MSALFNACLKANQEVIRAVGTTPPDHYANGLPFEADGSLCMTTDPPTHYHQGLPFAANNRISATGSAPDMFNSGAMPLSGGQLSTLSGGLAIAAVHGVTYSPEGRLNAGLGTPPAFTYGMLVGDNDGGVLRGFRANDDPNSPPAFGEASDRSWGGGGDLLGRFQANTTGGGLVIFGSVGRQQWAGADNLSVDVENYGVLAMPWSAVDNDYRLNDLAFGAFLDGNLGQAVRWNVTPA